MLPMEEIQKASSLRPLVPFLGPLVAVWLAAAGLIAAQIA